ncbi:heparan-alpha-glucosaminide N-acetyltransferase domain-containing protein [Dyella amyloliquefaciens]|uniref:acyltransferase family protein n=1 Tax=Dyella amyloliquefaciens TaxID=1770545 RepID=UPI00102E3A5F
MTRRLASVDALRGCTVALMLLVNDAGDWGHTYAPLEHAQWHGCTLTDLVFPFFLFVVGVSIALTIGPRIERGDDRGALARAAMTRALRIVLLGLAIHVLGWLLYPGGHMRFPGVLQRIGFCFAVAALFAIYTRARVQWIAIAVILPGYWVLLLAGGSLEPFVNIASRTDSAIFGRFVYLIDPATGRGHDPEGLLSSFPALATSLLGLRAGQWLRDGSTKSLLVAGVLALLLGYAWSLVLPFNKNLWTSSFVLWTGGWAMLVLALFHALVDRHGWPAMGRRFGMNAVVAYAGSELMQILLPAWGIQDPLYRRAFASWITPLAGPYVASLAYGVAFVALWWAVVYAMDRRQLYLKL